MQLTTISSLDLTRVLGGCGKKGTPPMPAPAAAAPPPSGGGYDVNVQVATGAAVQQAMRAG